MIELCADEWFSAQNHFKLKTFTDLGGRQDSINHDVKLIFVYNNSTLKQNLLQSSNLHTKSN